MNEHVIFDWEMFFVVKMNVWMVKIWLSLVPRHVGIYLYVNILN